MFLVFNPTIKKFSYLILSYLFAHGLANSDCKFNVLYQDFDYV